MFEAGFVIGFITALAITGAVAWLVGAVRIARVSQALAGGRRCRMRRAGVRTTATRTEVEHEVFQALIGYPRITAYATGAGTFPVLLKCSPFAASRAVVAARSNAPQEFEPLFRAALSELDPKTQAKARFQDTPAGRTM